MESLRFWIYAIKSTKDPALDQLTQVSKQIGESLLLETFTSITKATNTAVKAANTAAGEGAHRNGESTILVT
jgi:hypothetical protein